MTDPDNTTMTDTSQFAGLPAAQVAGKTEMQSAAIPPTTTKGTFTTNPADLPPTVFDTMTAQDAVGVLQGIKQEASAVVQSGDQASSSAATKVGVLAHVLLNLIDLFAPQVAPEIAAGEEIAAASGDAIASVTKKPNFLTDLFG
jgi:hypothetical protein